MSESKDPMEMLSFDEEEYKLHEMIHADRPRGVPDLRICACGHGAARHHINPYIKDRVAYICKMPNGTCPCKELRPTLKVKTTKPFVKKTLGPGVAHALIRTLQSLKESDREHYDAVEWLIPFNCEKCEAEGVKISPVNMSFGGVFTEEPNDVTVFLCDNCRFPARED